MTTFTDLPVIVIAGPTGVGKTDLSIEICHKFNGEVINGDSLQVYNTLDIGTGKITEEEKEGTPHHLLSVLEPWENYDASSFKESAHKKIIEITNRGNLPVIVGGTGLYLEGLLYDMAFGGADSHNQEAREKLTKEAEEIGEKALWERLNEIDPEAASKIPYQNVRRTIRALEVIEVTGDLFSSQTDVNHRESVYNELLIVLDRDRDKLYERINQRVLMMDKAGLENEARKLYEDSQGKDWQSIKGIGYKEWWPYFNGQLERESVIENIQQNSRRYAKRQLTWFRNRMKNPHWISLDDESAGKNKAIALVRKHLATVNDLLL